MKTAAKSYVQIIDSQDRVRFVEESQWPLYGNKEACEVLGVVQMIDEMVVNRANLNN